MGGARNEDILYEKEKRAERKVTWVHPGLDEEALRSVKAEVSPCVNPSKNRQLKKLVQTPQNAAFSHDGYSEALNSF